MKASQNEQKELLRLQAVDTRLQQTAHQLANLPQTLRLAELTKQGDELRRRWVTAMGELDDVNLELSRLESDVAVVEARIKRDNDRVQQTASVKDVQALEAELSALRKRQNDLEEIELTVMERAEERQAAVTGIDGERATLADEVSVVEQERDRAAESFGTQREELVRDRDAVAATIAEDLRELYEKQRTLGGGVGAALLRARTCGGCTMTITGADLAAVRNAPADEVLFCPDCGRILVRTEESGI